ncbi:MAG: EFR1 family ferrodoxin [Peptoniphilus sp.]|uniref:EFR1 family ferrodoxin n=1 Tax=Peptoniphilus sp. TaxID=1971214 RepID=UPI002A75D8F7|nr:EFR1 family ferrodoxin [Peptoniphilus sp.]MDY2987395.1 EFR1 family ferrodoxin [Peptoniphilus sp.]
MSYRICSLYFSATTTTDKVVHEFISTLKKELDISEHTDYDFTLPHARETMPEFNENDIVVVGVPTYAGRVPNLLLPYLSQINAKGALGVSIVLYGNRNFDDSLIELTELMTNGGIKVVGSGAFIGEHSFSTTLGAKRPDESDMKIVREFATGVAEKIKSNNLSESKPKGETPIRPYFTPQDRHGNKINFVKIKPMTDLEACINCKICAKSCPLGSIDFEDVSQVPGKCMKCCACVKKCPTGAKYFSDEGYLFHQRELEEVYERRNEPVYFL